MIVYYIVCSLAFSQASSYITYGGSYLFYSTLELSENASIPVGYKITASAQVQEINQQLLLANLQDIKLHYFTKKLPNVGFKESRSSLDLTNNAPYFIEINSGYVTNIYISSNEEPSLTNIKKGFASLFQFQTKSSEGRETDTSGTCDVKYEVSDNLHIKKYKNNCQKSKQRTLWGGSIISSRTSDIHLENSNKLLSIVYKESHILQPSLADFDMEILSRMELVYEKDYIPAKLFGNLDIKTTLSKAEKEFGNDYIAHDLKTEYESAINKQKRKPSKFSSVVKDNSKNLSDTEFGTQISAKAALNVISAAKEASQDEIYKSLKSKSNKKIRGQLIDVLGAVQTKDSHKAATQFLNLTSDKAINLDLCERYLWALSISPVHNKAIIEDLMQLLQNEFSDMKLYETLVQTVSSMVKKYSEDTNESELLEKTLKLFTENLKKCKKDDELCQRIYLKSFKNIASPRTLNLVLEYALNSTPSIGVRAMKAVYSLGPYSWNEEVIKTAERILFTNGMFDSSAKIIALDILLETSSSDFCLAKILNILRQQDSSKELKEYLLQRLNQYSQKNKSFEKNLKSILTSEGLNNYNALAQGGLSTAFERRFMDNGFLSTTQEVMSGLLKQGYVHVNLEENNTVQTVFTLGLFSNGLSSFVSSENEESSNSGELYAGLELTVLGVEFRPFIFFEGNGELMGHVFSGTASSMTPAYQAVLLLEDDTINIPLAIGQTAKVQFSSVASVDLSGKIEISLWSRTAESLVQNGAGILKKVTASVTSSFVQCAIEHEITAEPQLSLTSYTEFHGQMGICLQLTQPDIVIEYSSSKHENIPGTKQKIKKSYVRRSNIPGRSYVLNSKNNEMCNQIYPAET